MKVREWSRRRKAVVGAICVLLAVSGIAVALFIARARVEGNVSSAKLDVRWTGSESVVSQDNAACTVSLVNGGTLRITMTDAFPGAQCRFRGLIQSSADSIEGKIHAITLTGLPAGFTAELAPGIRGSIISAGGSSPTWAEFVLRAAPDLSGQVSGAIDAASSGIEVVPSSQFTP